MKKRITTILASVLLLAPFSAWAAQCCITPATATAPESCSQKTLTCPTGTQDIDCAQKAACSDFLPKGDLPGTGTSPEFPIIAPKIPLNIPTIDTKAFLNVKTDGTYIYIPFISVFLVGAYKLGMGIAGVLAVIMIMVGGFIWIAAAGDAGKIKKAKQMISGAVVGLTLTFGAYTFLQTVNPDLINFSALKIPVIAQKLVDVDENFNPEVETAAAPQPTTGAKKCPGTPNSGAQGQFDKLFEKYAPCAGVTPETLKAIAKVESGLDANKVNASGYIGLFQTKASNCPAVVSSYCGDLCNPENNIAAGAAMIAKSISAISRACPNASGHDAMVMIYIGHNMGPGMLQTVMKKTCKVSDMRQIVIDAYAANWPSTAKSYSRKYQQGCLNGGKSEAECTGGPKFDYALRLADQSGVKQVFASSSDTCPY